MAPLIASAPDDPRVVQAEVLWAKGIVPESGMSFDRYLETIPPIPEELKPHDERFPRLILVDARLGIVKTCELLVIDYDGSDKTFEDFDPAQARVETVYWIRCQDGKRYCDKTPRDCREEFVADEIGLVVHEGLALFAQDPDIFLSWATDIPGSVTRNERTYSAYLYWFNDRPKLDWRRDNHNRTIFGSGSRRV